MQEQQDGRGHKPPRAFQERRYYAYMIGAGAVTVMLGRDQSQWRKVLVPGAGTSTFVLSVG